MIFRTTNSNAPAADTVKLLRAEMHTIHSSAAPVHLSGCCSVCSATAPLWMRLCPRAAARHLPRRQRKVRKSSVLGFLLERSEIWVAGGGNNGSTIFIGVVLGLFGWDWANFLCACSLGLWKQEHIRNMLGRKHKNSPFIKDRERERPESISYQYQIPWVNYEDSILFVLPFGIFCYNLENQKGNSLTVKSVTTVSYVLSVFLHMIQLQFTIHLFGN